MKNIIFRNNTVPEGSSIYINNSKSKIFDNIVFEGNLTDETHAPYGTVADQGIKLILAGNTRTLKVRCTLWNTSGNVPIRLDHSSFYK